MYDDESRQTSLWIKWRLYKWFWFVIISKQIIGNKIYNKTLILGCRSNYECMMMNPNKPICDSDGMCVGGLSYKHNTDTEISFFLS